MEMSKVQANAKRRRDKFLAEKERTGCTIAKLALKYKITAVRMGQLLKKAKGERDGI